jgi:ketosteroid isomerase-like protein
MKASPTLVIPCAVLALAACGAKSPRARTPVDTAAIIGAIKADEVHWNSDLKNGDVNVLTGHYAPTAPGIIPGAAPMVGTAAIRAGLADALADKAFTRTFASDKVDVAGSGDLAAARGTYTETETDPRTKTIVTDRGSYVAVYKPQPDGVWRAIWDIDTPGAPVAQAAAGR